MRLVLGYIDSGTGATLMQLLLAGTVGVGAVVKLKWHSVKALFGRSRSGDLAATGENVPSLVKEEQPPS